MYAFSFLRLVLPQKNICTAVFTSSVFVSLCVTEVKRNASEVTVQIAGCKLPQFWHQWQINEVFF